MDTGASLQILIKEIPVCRDDEFAGMRNRIRDHVDLLIRSDFQRLLYILYHVDISEEKLKDMLRGEPSRDAADIITELLIERQVEKYQSRQKYGKGESGDW